MAKPEVERLLGIFTGDRPPPELVTAVQQRTEGNPLFVGEIARMITRGEEMEEPALLTSIPEGVRDTIGRRLNRLSEDCNRALVIASVIGREFELRQLIPLVEEVSEDRLLEALEEALAARIIEEIPQVAASYQFAHALIQETLTEELTVTRRVRLHARIADVLEGLYGERVEAHAAELAFHFGRAETVLGPEKLIKYSILAGEAALTAHAWAEAQALFQHGLDSKGVSLDDPGPARDGDEAALLFGLGRAYLVTLPTDRLPEGLLCLDRAFQFYANTGDVTNAIRVAEYPPPRTYQPLNKVEARIERGLSLVPPDSVAAGRLLPVYGVELGRLENDYVRAQEAFDRALAIARRVGDRALELRALAASAEVDYFHLSLEECLAKSLRVIELADTVGDAYLKVYGHLNALQSAIHLGDREESEERATAGLALAEQLNSRPFLSSMLRCGVNLYRLLGNWHTAREMAQRHQTMQQSYVPLRKELASLEYELGEFRRGEDHLAEMVRIMKETPSGPGPEYADTSLVAFYASSLTDPSDHIDIAEQAADVVLSTPLAQPFRTELVRTGLALRALQVGDARLAQEQYEALAGLPGHMRGSHLCADRLLGQLAQIMGNQDLATVHFENALAFCRREGWQPELAWTCLQFAQCLHQLGTAQPRARVAALLEESQSIAEQLGMNPLLERIGALQERMTTATLSSRPSYPAGLSHREVAVLRLVAAGKTDREIAEELSITPRTAGYHVSNILNKTNSTNRTEAATYASQHSLI